MSKSHFIFYDSKFDLHPVALCRVDSLVNKRAGNGTQILKCVECKRCKKRLKDARYVKRIPESLRKCVGIKLKVLP